MNEYLTPREGFGYPRNRMADASSEVPPIIQDDDEIVNAGPTGRERRGEGRRRDREQESTEAKLAREDAEREARSRVPTHLLENPALLAALNQKDPGRQMSSKDIVGEIAARFNIAQDPAVAMRQAMRGRDYARALMSQLDREKRDADKVDPQIDSKIENARNLIEQFDEVVRQLGDGGNLESLKEEGLPLFGELGEGLSPYEGKGNPQDYIHSLEELAEVIQDQSGDEWQPGGPFELIDREGVFHPENFHAWIRERIWFYDDFSPDTDINLFSDIAIPTVFRSISFQEMYSTDRYFRKRVTSATGDVSSESDGVYNDFKDQLLWEVWLSQENHNNDTRYRLVSGIASEQQKAMQQMHHHNIFVRDRNRLLRMLRLPSIDQLESFHTNKSEYSNLINNKVQGEVGKEHQRTLLAYMYLPDREMFRKVFTKEGNTSALDAFYENAVQESFAEKTRALKIAKWRRENKDRPELEGRTDPTEKEIDGVEIHVFGEDRNDFFEELNRNTQAQIDGKDYFKGQDYFRRAVNISREEFDSFLENNLGKEKFALKAMTYKFGTETDVDRQHERPDPHSDPLFKAWNDVKVPDEDATNGMYDVFNIYGNIRLPEERIQLVRKGIKAALEKIEENDKIQEIGDGEWRRLQQSTDPKDKDKLSRWEKRRKQDVKFAEMWGYRMSYWTGIAVYNDTRAIAHDKWGQPINTRYYRQRQAMGRGASGIEDTVVGLKRMSLNLWQGLKVKEEGGRAFDKMLVEVIQGGQGDKIDLDKDITTFDFDGNAQRQWFNDHIATSWKLTDFLMDKHGMNLDQFLKYDYRGKLIIDYEKFDEVIDGFIWHDIRYFLDQGGFLWNSKIRSWDRDENGKLIFHEQELKKHMFSDQVLNMNMYERGHLPKDHKDYSERMADEAKNGALARNVMAYLIAKEIKWHMADRPGAVKWNLHEVESINTLLQAWKYEKHFDPDTEEVIKTIPFFSHHELEHIGEMGDADEQKMKRNIWLQLLAMFIIGTVWGSVKESRKVVTDAAKT